MARKKKGEPAAVAAPPGVSSEFLNEQFDRVDLAAVAWAGLIRLRLRNLFEEVDVVNGLNIHPQSHPGALVVLRARVNADALGRLWAALEDAELATNDLLGEGVEETYVPLAAICREAASKLKLGSAERT